MKRIRALLDEADEAPVEEAPADEAPVEEGPADEAPVDEEAPADEEVPADEEAPADEAPVDEEAPADVDELQATIRTMAAEIETLRNRLAEAGIEVDTPDEPVEAEIDELEDTPTEDEQVEAFDSDYETRKARLAEITGRN